jgi:hypothetical protein
MFFGGSLVGFLIYGSAARNYEVLAPIDSINSQQVDTFVEEYKPYIYQNESYAYTPTKLFYEVVEQLTTYVVIYRVVWEDELHPSKFFHALYRPFRIITFGSANDIEFVEYIINKTTFQITEVHFETIGGESTTFPDHEYVALTNNSGTYNYFGDDGITEDLSFNPFDGFHCNLLVCSWNHLLNVSSTLSGTLYDLPLDFLTDEDFKSYKMSSRSAGIISSKRSGAIIVPIAFAVLFAAIPFPSYYLAKYIKKRGAKVASD